MGGNLPSCFLRSNNRISVAAGSPQSVVSMAARGFDSLYRSTLMRPIIPRIFTNGLGNPVLLERLVSNFQYFRDPDFIRKFLIGKFGRHHPIQINKRTISDDKKCHVLEGTFQSPFNELVPNSMPVETRTAHFIMLVPRSASRSPPPMVVHLAGTGDYSVNLQERHARRLADHGVASLLLVNPFYRPRRPNVQKSSSLLHMSDLFVMGGSLILECWLLLRWLESRGYGPLALHGLSMGGYMASLAASVYNRPLALVPCLSWTTSSPCYVRGVLSDSMSWPVIRQQLAGDTAFRERVWPKIRDASCPQRYRVPQTLGDPLRQPEAADAVAALAVSGGKIYGSHHPQLSTAEAAAGGSLESLRTVYTRFYSSMSGFGVGLFAAGERLVDTLIPALRQTQLVDAMETKHMQQQQRQQKQASSAAGGGKRLTAEEEEMREFVTCLLDYFTHMGNYEKPVGPVYSLQALDDAYIPRDGVFPLTELWPGMECRLVDGGHVTTIFNNCYWGGKPHDLRDIVLHSVGIQPPGDTTQGAK